MKVAKEGAILLLLSVKSCTCTVPIGQSWVNGGGHLKFTWVGLVDVGKTMWRAVCRRLLTKAHKI